mgnify:CR=1 FL=1
MKMTLKPIASGVAKDAAVDVGSGLPRVRIDGLGFGFDAIDYAGENIPIAGKVFVGGLQTGDYYFSGTARANIKGNKVDGIIAFDTDGLRGVCFGLNGADVPVENSKGEADAGPFVVEALGERQTVDGGLAAGQEVGPQLPSVPAPGQVGAQAAFGAAR